MQAKVKPQKPRGRGPSAKTLQRGLKVGRAEWDRVLLETVRHLGQATAEDVATAADLDIRRVQTALRRLAKGRKLGIIRDDKYGITARGTGTKGKP